MVGWEDVVGESGPPCGSEEAEELAREEATDAPRVLLL